MDAAPESGRPDLLIVNAAEIATVDGSPPPRLGSELGEVHVCRDGFISVQGSLIDRIGAMADLPAAWRPLVVEATPASALGRTLPSPTAPLVIDAAGRSVIPGFVDPHTHVVYAGDRTAEFKLRIGGAAYAEIARAGGGILSTMRATRAAAESDLVTAARDRLHRMLLHGTTALEIKSGYALDTPGELKMLAAIAALQRQSPQEIIATFLGAHEIPPEHRSDPEAYVRVLVEEMLPAVAHQGVARFCDVFVEDGVFTIDQGRRILEAGKAYQLAPRLHADELVADFGGAELAAAVGARTADHLLYASEAGLTSMAANGVAAVLLPGTPFFLMLSRYAPARRMIQLGVPVALATDCNPGSCPIESMAVVIGLACLQMRMTPAEALTAATLNAAWALGMESRLGSLTPGKQADLLILQESTYEAIPYRFGTNLVDVVVKGGQVLAAGGRLVRAGAGFPNSQHAVDG